MKALKKIIFASFVLGALLFTGCTKTSTTDGNTTGANDYVAPAIAKDSLVKIPLQLVNKEQNGDYSLIYLILGETFINTYSTSLAGWFLYDQSSMSGWNSKKNSDGSTTYSWKYFTFSVNLIYFHSSSESWWKYQYDSASYKYTYCYVDDKGTSGEVDFYSKAYFKQDDKLAIKDSYTKSGSTTNSTFLIYNPDASVSERYDAVSNSDRSGTMKIYTQINSAGTPVLQYFYTWDKYGVGSYTTYGPDGTTVSGTGTY